MWGDSDETDAALIEWFRSGDRFAFERLLERYDKSIYTAAYAVLGNVQQAVDLTTNTVRTALLELRRGHVPGDVNAWLRGIVISLADERTGDGRSALSPGPRIENTSIPELDPEWQRVVTKEIGELLWCGLRSLPYRAQKVLVLRVPDELDINDMADILGMDTVRAERLLEQATGELRSAIEAQVVAGAGRKKCTVLDGLLVEAHWVSGPFPSAANLPERIVKHADGCGKCEETRNENFNAAKWLLIVIPLLALPSGLLQRIMDVAAELTPLAEVRGSGDDGPSGSRGRGRGGSRRPKSEEPASGDGQAVVAAPSAIGTPMAALITRAGLGRPLEWASRQLRRINATWLARHNTAQWVSAIQNNPLARLVALILAIVTVGAVIVASQAPSGKPQASPSLTTSTPPGSPAWPTSTTFPPVPTSGPVPGPVPGPGTALPLAGSGTTSQIGNGTGGSGGTNSGGGVPTQRPDDPGRNAPSCLWQTLDAPGPQANGVLNAMGGSAGDDVWATGRSSVGGSPQGTAMHWDGRVWTVALTPTVGIWSQLFGVAAPSRAFGWATGATAATGTATETLIERWDGVKWTRVTSPNFGAHVHNLFGVWAPSTIEAWTVGWYGDRFDTAKPLALHWDGTTWGPVAPQEVGSAATLVAVAGSGPGDVWAVGDSVQAGLHRTLIEHWNGRGWQVVDSPSVGGVNNSLHAVRVRSFSDAWAVGEYNDPGTHTSKPLALHWDGQRWSRVDVAEALAGTGGLFDVVVVSDRDVWVLGYAADGTSHALLAHWDGSSWSSVSTPATATPGGQFSAGLAFGSAAMWGVGWITGADGSLRPFIQRGHC